MEIDRSRTYASGYHLEELDPMLGVERHDRLLPILGVAAAEPGAARLALAILRVDATTFTLNNSSTARRTSSFVACVFTSNA